MDSITSITEATQRGLTDMQWLLKNPNFSLHLLNQTNFKEELDQFEFFAPTEVLNIDWQDHRNFDQRIHRHLKENDPDKAFEVFAEALRDAIQAAEKHDYLKPLAKYAREHTDVEL